MIIDIEKMGAGERITYCRASLSLTRKELSIRWGMASVPTLSRWELGTVPVPSKKMPKLTEFFRKEGLIVSDEWLIKGEGAPPQRVGGKFLPEVNFDTIAQEMLLTLNQKTPNFYFGMVATNHMAPFVNYGDYIGGVNTLVDDINDKTGVRFGDFVFVSYDNKLEVGLYEEQENSIVLKNHISKNISIGRHKVNSLGKILWVNRRP